MAQNTNTNRRPQIDELAGTTAPDEFKRAIVRDPYASIFRFDFDAFRGTLDSSLIFEGKSVVPLSGYYLDLDGTVINYYQEGTLFPHLAPTSDKHGRFLFLTDRRDATTSDLRFIALRRGWEDDVRNIHIR